MALLALVAGQDVEPAEGSDGTDGRWRIARQVAPGRMISTVDPDTRHAHKTRERRQDGFKAHVVVEPDTGLITNTGLTKATGPDNSDATVGIALLHGDPSLRQDSRAGRGAGGLGLRHRRRAGRARDRRARRGDQAVAAAPGDRRWVHPRRLHDQRHLRHTTPGDLPERDHPPDDSSRQCPFRSACNGCPLRARCTADARGRKLTLGPHHRSNAPTAPAPPPPSTSGPIAVTGPWSNAPSPG